MLDKGADINTILGSEIDQPHRQILRNKRSPGVRGAWENLQQKVGLKRNEQDSKEQTIARNQEAAKILREFMTSSQSDPRLKNTEIHNGYMLKHEGPESTDPKAWPDYVEFRVTRSSDNPGIYEISLSGAQTDTDTKNIQWVLDTTHRKPDSSSKFPHEVLNEDVVTFKNATTEGPNPRVADYLEGKSGPRISHGIDTANAIRAHFTAIMKPLVSPKG